MKRGVDDDDDSEGFCLECIAPVCECKKCSRCSFKSSSSGFKGENGKDYKLCDKCRSKKTTNHKISKAEKLITLSKAIEDDKTLKICTNCTKALPILNFKTLKNGDVSKNCIICLDKCREKKKRRKEKSPERVGKLNSEQAKRTRKNIGRDKEREREHKWIKNNPEKYKYKTLKNNAKYRGIEFDISFNESKDLYMSACEYCGILEEGKLNTIDRFINSDGYIKGNNKPACNACNNMKSEWSFESFVAYCGHISAFNNLSGKTCKDRLPYSKRNSYNKYKSKAVKKGRSFIITEEQFNEITNNPCVYCGKENSENHSNGVNCIVKKVGFEYENCQSCCYNCNRSTFNQTPDEFVKRCEKIYLKFYQEIEFHDTLFEKIKKIKK